MIARPVVRSVTVFVALTACALVAACSSSPDTSTASTDEALTPRFPVCSSTEYADKSHYTANCDVSECPDPSELPPGHHPICHPIVTCDGCSADACVPGLPQECEGGAPLPKELPAYDATNNPNGCLPGFVINDNIYWPCMGPQPAPQSLTITVPVPGGPVVHIVGLDLTTVDAVQYHAGLCSRCWGTALYKYFVVAYGTQGNGGGGCHSGCAIGACSGSC